MPKKSNRKRRGIERGVAKHKVRSLQGPDQDPCNNDKRKFLGLSYSIYFELGRKSFDFMSAGCDKLFLVPFTKNDQGEYVEREWKGKLVHYFTLVIGLLIFAHKTWGCATMLLYEELKIETFMSTSLFQIYFGALAISVGALAKPRETIDLLNGFGPLLSSLEDIQGVKLNLMDDLSTALQVITVLLVTQGIAIAAGILTVIFNTLPVCWLTLVADDLDLIPPGVMSRFWWGVVFFPLEWITYLPPLFLAPVTGSVRLLGAGMMKVYAHEVRKICVTNFRRREKVERLYLCLEIFNRTFSTWLYFALPFILIGASATIIVTLFVAIRYTELPFIFYFFYPYTGCTLMFIIFWVTYGEVSLIRASEDILLDLTSYDVTYLRGMPKAERTEVLKRAKAMHVLVLPIGPFSECSMTLPITVWEEVINQLVMDWLAAYIFKPLLPKIESSPPIPSLGARPINHSTRMIEQIGAYRYNLH